MAIDWSRLSPCASESIEGDESAAPLLLLSSLRVFRRLESSRSMLRLRYLLLDCDYSILMVCRPNFPSSIDEVACVRFSPCLYRRSGETCVSSSPQSSKSSRSSRSEIFAYDSFETSLSLAKSSADRSFKFESDIRLLLGWVASIVFYAWSVYEASPSKDASVLFSFSGCGRWPR